MRWGSMITHKMRSPAFPPRRPSALLRYLVPAFIIITLFYYLRPVRDDPLSRPPQDGSRLAAQPVPPVQITRPDADANANANDNNKNGQLRQQRPAGKNAETPSEFTVKQQHEVNQPALSQQQQEPIVDPAAAAAAAKPKEYKPGPHGNNNNNRPDAKAGADAPKQAAGKGGSHPIDRLIEIAEKQFQDTIAEESHTLAEAAAAYRKRRGRHPPPGFDKWYQYAQERNALMVESFWDQIYHDLEPFWALPAREIRKGAWDYEMTINVRSGQATAQSDWFWTQIWLSLIQTIQHLLPDMDLALNAMDEPRLVVPWEKMNEYMNKASAARGMVPAKDVLTGFEKLAPPGQGPERSVELAAKNWEATKPYWKVVKRGCAPDSEARKAEDMTDFDHAPIIQASFAEPHMYKGFVSNYTMSTSICHQPDLQGLNGMFIEPLTVSATKTLFPMFGGSKLSVNNEILLPAPMYWNEEERFTGGGDTGVRWGLKEDGVIWRGVATGGKNLPTNWRAFQRHRFVAMNNATKLDRAEDRVEKPANFELPSPSYDLAAQKPMTPGSIRTRLPDWVNTWADVAFVDLMCEPGEEDGRCYYTSPHFSVEQGIRLAEQFNWKYLPDIDGNSFSGRYLGFLRSTSLPIKATVYREWHDSRLIAWKHFVPMDNRYGDWFGIMEYFLGYGSQRPGHDAAAEKIASDGKAWAEKVLRKEDMQIYVLRLLLEYARVSDDRREKMGWVADLLDNSGSPPKGT